MKKPKLGAAWAEYVFLDVVGYSKRTPEAQNYVVETLNRIVREAVEAHHLGSDHVIFVPTGDGMCVVLLNVGDPYDIQMQIALTILERLHEHNSRTADEDLRFKVRIGVNANKDNVIVDINGNRNVSGVGVNDCSRIMGQADGSQILVGTCVFETLKSRKEYVSAFRRYLRWRSSTRFLSTLPVRKDGLPFLDVNTPAN